jgi:hypothetical protein
MAENLLDHGGLFNECDDSRGTSAAGARKRIDFVHLLDEARPGARRR